MSFTVTEHASILAAARIEERLRALDGPRVLAIPGGSTPGPVLDSLDLASFGDQLTLTLVDERHLPVTEPLDEQCNTRLLRQYAVGPTVEWVLPGSVEEAADVLEKRCPTPDVVLLGMGPDGHIASLFPGREHRGRRILAVHDSPKPPPLRLSMSLDLIDAASYVLVVVRGRAKAEAVARAWRRDPALPTSSLTTRVEWLLDPEAAALLPEIR